MKKTKIIIPALGILLLSTAASVTGTVAWFSMNASVNVQGMKVRTKVSDNLFIAADTLSSTSKQAEANFGPGPLNQYVGGIFEPASTVDGLNFWYTKIANADGSKADGNWIKYGSEEALAGADATTYDSPFSKYYGITKTQAADLFPAVAGQWSAATGAIPYADYVFQLKAVNSASTATPLKLTGLNLTYTKSASEVDENKSYRTAIFVEDITAGTASATPGTLNMIYAPDGAVNQEGGKAVNSATATAAVTYNTANQVLASVTANSTKYYKVVVRLWLEGEDKTCTNATFAALNGSWALDLTCTLDNSTDAVEELTLA